jgi:hypothetical protein
MRYTSQDLLVGYSEQIYSFVLQFWALLVYSLNPKQGMAIPPKRTVYICLLFKSDTVILQLVPLTGTLEIG